MNKHGLELIQCEGWGQNLKITPAACKARQQRANKGLLDYPNAKACRCCRRHPKHEEHRAEYARVHAAMKEDLAKAVGAAGKGARKEAGVCPACGERPRRVYSTGTIGRLCAVCDKARRRRYAQKQDPGRQGVTGQASV